MTNQLEDAINLYLARLTLRSVLGKAEREALLDAVRAGTVQDVHGDFVRVGDKVTHACLIVEGLAARFAQIRNGSRGFVALHIPGDMADLHSVVAPNVSWALSALRPTKILRVPHTVLRKLADDYPALALAFWRDCVADENIIAQWAVNVSRKDALGRVAHLFAEMCERYAAIGIANQDGYPFSINQIDLADAVGLTSVHLNRVLKRLREDGIATKESARVIVHDRKRLWTEGEFDPAYLQLNRDERE